MKKNRILFVSLFLITMSVISNNINKLNKIQTPNVVDQVYERLEVSNRLPRFTNSYIDRLSQNRQEVSASLWQTIKNTMDYSEFKNLATQILLDNYTSSELQNLLTKYSDEPFIPIEYISLRNRLYEALEQFNSNIISQINSILVANNHSIITPN